MCYIQKNIGKQFGKQSQCKSIVGCNKFSLDTQINSVQGKHCVYFCRKFQKCCHFRFIQHQKLMKKEKIAQKFKVILEDLSSQLALDVVIDRRVGSVWPNRSDKQWVRSVLAKKTSSAEPCRPSPASRSQETEPEYTVSF